MKNPKSLDLAVENLQKENLQLSKELEKLKLQAAGNIKQDLVKKIVNQGDFKVLIEEVELGSDEIKTIAFQLKAEVKNLIQVLVSKANNQPSITIAIDEDLAKSKDWNAGNMVRELAKLIQGGGGGQPFFATAGGKNVDGISAVLKAAKEMFLRL